MSLSLLNKHNVGQMFWICFSPFRLFVVQAFASYTSEMLTRPQHCQHKVVNNMHQHDNNNPVWGHDPGVTKCAVVLFHFITNFYRLTHISLAVAADHLRKHFCLMKHMDIFWCSWICRQNQLSLKVFSPDMKVMIKAWGWFDVQTAFVVC